AGMVDLVLQGASTPLTRVAPVMLRDEFLLAAGRDLTRIASHGHAKLVLPPLESPSVGDPAHGPGTLAGHGDAMTHRHGEVVLAVEDPGRHGDGGTRHQLLDEDHGAPPALARPPPDVEAQVDLLEVATPRKAARQNPHGTKHAPQQPHAR